MAKVTPASPAAEAAETPLRKYKHYPVVEALCEVIFEGSEWDETSVGQFYDRIKEKFPVRKRMEMRQAEINLSGAEPTTDIHKLPPRTQFVNEAGNLLIQIRKNLLVVNQLRPYPRFTEWEPNIYVALKHYWELAKPTGVRRIGLRYINRIVIPHIPIRMEDYFEVYPKLPTTWKDEHGSFMVRVHLECEQKGHSVLLTLATAPSDKPGAEITHMLDLYAIFHAEALLTEAAVPEQTGIAHKNVNKAFEGSITEKLRMMFGPEE